MNGQAKMQEPLECAQSAKVLTGTGKRKFIIYKATNLINGKNYIGQTVETLKLRMTGHINKAKRNPAGHFHYAIRKYGADVFIWETIWICSSKDEANKKECEFIKAFNTKTPAGYNATDGGDGRLGFCPTEETRMKVSKANKGRTKSEEWRKKLSNALIGRKTGRKDNLGRKHSAESKAKMSKSLLGNKRMVGLKISEKTKAKISQALKGRKLSEERRVKLIGNKYSLGHKHSEETRAKISRLKKGNTYCLGHRLSSETREKISNALTGRKRSEETIAKMRRMKNGLGCKRSEETKSLISKALKGRQKSEETRAKMSAAKKGRPARPPLSVVK